MFEEIKKYFEENNIAKMRYTQLEESVFKLSRIHFDEIIQYPKLLREDLNSKFEIVSLRLVNTHKSEESVKFVLETKDKSFIEVVLMQHDDKRRTVCVSSQIFCPLGCKFCATGANKYKRNLTADEIVSQVLFANHYLKKEENARTTNVVFMGMGEPFLNYENVISAIDILNEKLEIGARHITVSTAGIIDKIEEFANYPKQIRLAISLHAPNDKLRDELMPINKKYPISELIKATDNFSKITNKRVSFEYVLIKDINDSSKNAFELAKLLEGKLAHVNILVYNEHPFAKYKKPEQVKVREFKKILDENGIETSIRRSMGDDISGACGQLAGSGK